MSELKRLEVKYIRDGAKAAYKKADECYICGTNEELQFHHFATVTLLWEQWKKNNKVVINDVEDILVYRDQFTAFHHSEMYDGTVTLCKLHHMGRLHKVYGKTPPLHTAQKQKRWCERQRIKLEEKQNGNTVKK